MSQYFALMWHSIFVGKFEVIAPSEIVPVITVCGDYYSCC